MTTLAPLDERNSIGIDSFERAIAYSAHLLYSSFSIRETEYNKDFSIVPNEVSKRINIRIEFPVNYQTFWQSNGNFIIGAANYSTSTIQYLGEYLPPSNGDFTVIPTEINTLERFFVYCVVEFRNYLLNNYPTLASNCTYQFNERKRTITINVVLPYEPQVYKDYLDLLLAVRNWKDIQVNNQDNLPFGNQFQLSNNQQLTN